MGRFFRVAWLVMRKDLRVETRSWEMLSTTLFFAVSCVLVFSFAFVREGRPIEGAASGILWIAIAFSGTLALGRAFERERRHNALRGLLMAPVERAAIFLGKLLGGRVADGGGRVDSSSWRSPSRSKPRCSPIRGISWCCSQAGPWGLPRSGRCSLRCCSGRKVAACSCRSCCIR